MGDLQDVPRGTGQRWLGYLPRPVHGASGGHLLQVRGGSDSLPRSPRQALEDRGDLRDRQVRIQDAPPNPHGRRYLEEADADRARETQYVP